MRAAVARPLLSDSGVVLGFTRVGSIKAVNTSSGRGGYGEEVGCLADITAQSEF